MEFLGGFQALQFLSKAHRCEVQAGGWEKDPAQFKEVVKRAVDMGEGENTQPPPTNLNQGHMTLFIE